MAGRKTLKHLMLSILLTGLSVTTAFQHDYENTLRRGEKTLSWKWTNVSPVPRDIQRKRRFLKSDVTEPWWKIAFQDYYSSGSYSSPLTLNEETYFAKIRHTPPFDDFEKIPPNDEDAAADTFDSTSHYGEVENQLLGKAIIDELHRPSKLELESATGRLKKENQNKEHFRDEKSVEEQDLPSVEYIVPTVELIEPHVEYVNKLEVVVTTPTISSAVEYIEPEIEYFPSIQKSNMSEKYSFVSSRDGSLEFDIIPFSKENLPVEESITIDRKQILQVFKRKEPKNTRIAHLKTSRLNRDTDITEKMSSIHQVGIPVDYLEIRRVAPFTCEDYPAPGYYADISARCQMFHICQENGQRSSFMCPFGTVFNQEYLICDWWYNVDCRSSHKHYGSLEAFSSNNKQIISIGYTAGSKYDSPVELGQTNIFNRTNKASNNQDESEISQFKLDMSLKNISTETISYSRSRNSSTKQPTITENNRTPIKQRPKASEVIMENVSMKAVNYPMGFTILRKHNRDAHLNRNESENSLRDRSTVEYVGRENTVVKIKLTPRVKGFRKKKRVYIGGLKPLVAPGVKQRKLNNSKLSGTDKTKPEKLSDQVNIEISRLSKSTIVPVDVNNQSMIIKIK